MAKLPTDNSESRPTPDPTILTTEQLLREVKSAKDIIDARIDGIDKSISTLEKIAEHRQRVVDDTVNHLKTLHEERFRSIAVQFTERDTRVEQTARDSKVAVDAALSAAKEAVGEQNKSSALAIAKSEAATAKQIDSIGININTTTNGINDKIEDIKTRLTAVDNRLTAIDNRTNGKSEGISSVGAIVLGAFTGLSALAAVTAIVITLVRH